VHSSLAIFLINSLCLSTFIFALKKKNRAWHHNLPGAVDLN